MVLISPAPNLPIESLLLYHTTDPNLSHAPILVFYGPATSTNTSSLASSRIQSHVFTPAGLQSYSRLAISPSSSLYGAVNCLSREEQGDETCRALAYSLLKYFSELPDIVKEAWIKNSLSADKPSTALGLFSERHAAELASRMRQAPDTEQAINGVCAALAPQTLSYLDIDLVLPSGAINATDHQEDDDVTGRSASSALDSRYGKYAPLLRLFGDPAFVPTARMRRAPSRVTAVNRAMVFSKKQKESLRREMCELIDTEDRYVTKLDELVNTIAADFRQGAKTRSNGSTSPDERMMKTLFPPELDQILRLNTDFFDACRKVVEDTEAAAIDDMQQTQPLRVENDFNDASGAAQLAKCLLEWLPKFADYYPKYMQAHSGFASMVKKYSSQSPASSFASRIHETGEQRLMSMLIEPVQRLPRYNLYLENIIKQLPVKHPALKGFLKAKDIIADICVQDAVTGAPSKTLQGLKQIIRSWPLDLQPRCRLITAIDMLRLSHPYDSSGIALSQPYVGVLFADQIVFLHKPIDNALSAHGLLAELENPSTLQLALDGGDHHSSALVYSHRMLLDSITVNEMSNGKLLRFTPMTRQDNTGKSGQEEGRLVQVFALAGSYENRAARLSRDIAKARVEGRFSDGERESPKWEVRDYEGASTGLGLFTSIFEADSKPAGVIKGFARAQVTVDSDQTLNLSQNPEEGANVAIAITLEGDGFFKVEVGSHITQKTRDLVTSAEFLPVLTKRLSMVAQMHASMRNPAITCYLLQNNEQILRSLKLPTEARGRSPSKPRSLRPHSPVKALTSMFSSFSHKDQELKSTPSEQRLPRISNLRPILPKMASDSKLTTPGLERSPSKVTLVSNPSQAATQSPVEALETILQNYVLALEARKGNVIGRVIANRALANEATVNELYNAILDQPSNHELAAQSSIDVLFAAFEKFLNNAWRESLGPVIDASTMDDLHYKSAMLLPYEYEEYLLKILNDLSPQNHRAFNAVLHLTTELLGGMTSDGDRGVLMATIAEILVSDGNPHDYMPLLDRFVEEHEVIFSNGCRSGQSTPYSGSMMSSSAARSTATGSFSSKASSFGKRLGFGSMSRENSKSGENKNVGHVLRTLSKAGRSGELLQNRSGIVDRTKSVDLGVKSSPSSRPGSRDRPTMLGAFEDHRPASGRSWDQVEPMESLTETTTIHQSGPRKKKRRSSLSEIEGLPLPNTSPFWGSPSPRRPEKSPLVGRSALLPPSQDGTPQTNSVVQSRSKFTSLLRPGECRLLNNAAEASTDPGTPTTSPTRSNAVRHKPLDRKENHLPDKPSSPPYHPFSAGTTLARANTQPTHNRSPSNLIPVPRGVLTERPGSGNTPPPPPLLRPTSSDANTKCPSSPTKSKLPSPSQSSSPSKKLRMQTPQRLRTRLQTQQKAISGAEAGLQAELAKIGEELAALNVQQSGLTTSSSSSSSPSETENTLLAGPKPSLTSSSSSTTTNNNTHEPQARKSSATLQNLSGRLKALETKLPHLVANLSRHTTMLEEEISGALKVADRRAREMENRASETEAENEALLARCNRELERIFERVHRNKGGDGDESAGVEELKRKLAESMRNEEKWRVEVGRLRGENAWLVAAAAGREGRGDDSAG